MQSQKSFLEHICGKRHRCLTANFSAPKDIPHPNIDSQITEDTLIKDLLAGRFQNIVMCTGAGVSTSAGIPDFRSKGGLFEHVQSRFGSRFPELSGSPEILLSRTFRQQYPVIWEAEVSPWLKSWKIKEAKPTMAHWFGAFLARRGWLRRLYTQNIDGLHTHPTLLDAAPALNDLVIECHGSIRDGTVVMYGDALPNAFFSSCREDFRALPHPPVDLVLVMGTSLQVAPVCAVPNLAPPGAIRVLINRRIADCLTNSFNPTPCSPYRFNPTIRSSSSTKLGGRLVTLRSQWTSLKRWRGKQLLVEKDGDVFLTRMFEQRYAMCFECSSLVEHVTVCEISISNDEQDVS